MKDYIELDPLRPSWAIGNEYQKTLRQMSRAMFNDIYAYTLEQYKRLYASIPADYTTETTMVDFSNNLDNRLNLWEQFFILKSISVAKDFIRNVDISIQTIVNANIKKISKEPEISPQSLISVLKWPHRKKVFSADIVRKSMIRENVELIQNIPSKVKEQITTQVLRAISESRSPTYLAEKIKKIGKFTDNRCKLIARDQLNKATNAISSAVYQEMGITKAVWKHSPLSKEPRKSHVDASGTVYELKTGCKIDGENIFPGQKINCNCFCIPVIENT
jgi:hypothetical protein